MRQTGQVQETLNHLSEFLKQHGGSASYNDYFEARQRAGRPVGMAEAAVLSNLPHLTDAITRQYKTHDDRVDTIWSLAKQAVRN